jgi:hypothetical protein
MLTDSVLVEMLAEMGIPVPPGAADPVLGPDLDMEQLEIRELCRRIKIALRIDLPDDRGTFRISRQDRLSGLVQKINQHARPVYESFLRRTPRMENVA